MRFMSNQKGYSVMVVPILLMVILFLSSFAFDYGRVILVKHELQSAADAAANAGAGMVKVVYKEVDFDMTDKDVETELETTDVEIVNAEANRILEINVLEQDFERRGIEITSTEGNLDGLNYSYRITAQVNLSSVVAGLGGRKKQPLTVFSEARPEDNKDE